MTLKRNLNLKCDPFVFHICISLMWIISSFTLSLIMSGLFNNTVLFRRWWCLHERSHDEGLELGGAKEISNYVFTMDEQCRTEFGEG